MRGLAVLCGVACWMSVKAEGDCSAEKDDHGTNYGHVQATFGIEASEVAAPAYLGKGKEIFKDKRDNRITIHFIEVAEGDEPRESEFRAPETVVWKILEAGTHETPMPAAHRPGDKVILRKGRYYVFEVNQEPKYSEEKVKELLARPKWSTDVGSGKPFLETRYVRMWDFMSYKEPWGADKYHQHTLDHAFVTIRPSALDLFTPGIGKPEDLRWEGKPGEEELKGGKFAQVPGPDVVDVYKQTFTSLPDGTVVYNIIDNGGFTKEGGDEPQIPAAVHSIELASTKYGVEKAATIFEEYLIELK